MENQVSLDSDPLEFWRHISSKYPILSTIANGTADLDNFFRI